MLSKPQVPAPEPCASAALWVLYRVVLFIRNEADSISPQQLSDLGEAIHNVPESLTEYGRYFNEAEIRDHFFKVYDETWARSPDDLSLVRLLEIGKARVTAWLQEQ